MISLVFEINRKAPGEFSFMKFLSFTAWDGLKTVRIMYLLSPVNEPLAFTIVAPRTRFFSIKLHIGLGSEQTT